MLLKLLISLFTSVKLTTECGVNPTDTIYVSNIEDTMQLGTCSAVNASVYIHGENNIGSLGELNGITEINGDLVITDNTELRNLKGLQNLQRVNGEDLYFDQYSIVITDNTKLAFVDRVNWTSITDYPTNFKNNANISVVCDSVCDNCFGPGPYLCQNCINTSFYNTSICLSGCYQYHQNTTYCHHVAPLPLEFSINDINSTCFNYTWDINIHEPYIDTITGVKVLLNNYSIYNYTIDDTGYYYIRNFTDTFSVCGLVPNTLYNLTGMLFGNDLMSNHTSDYIRTSEYYLDNITYIFVGHVNTSNNVLLVWNETEVPNDSYFDTAFTFYEIEINSTTNFNYTDYNFTNRYIIFNLENGNYTIRVKPIMTVSNYNHTYFGEWFSLDFEIFIITTPSTTQTTTFTTTPSTTQTTTESTTLFSTTSDTTSDTNGDGSSTSSTSIHKDTDDDDSLKTVVIVIIVLTVLLALIILYILVDRYREKKKQNMISRLTGRNKSTDRNPAVAYTNNSYETPGFSNEVLYSDPTYDNGYGDVVVNSTDDVGRGGSIKNESYDDNYFDC